MATLPPAAIESLPELVNRQQAADLFGIKPDTIKDLYKRNMLPRPQLIDGVQYWPREEIIRTYHLREENRERMRSGYYLQQWHQKNMPPKSSPPKRKSDKKPLPEQNETAVEASAKPRRRQARQIPPVTETPTPSPSKTGAKPGRKTSTEIANEFAQRYAHELTQQDIDSTEWHVLVGQVKAAVTIAKALKR